MSTPASKSVFVVLRPAQPVPVETLAREARAGRPITRAEFLARYDASAQDLETLAGYAAEFGLTMSSERPAWRVVELSGDVQAIRAAFPGGPAQPVPERLADIVHYVWRLRDIGPPKPPGPPPPTPDTDTTEEAGRREGQVDPRALWPEHHVPPDYVRYYGFPEQYDGKGQCVGVLSLLGGYRQTELETFFAKLEIPVPEIVHVGENVWATGPGELWLNYEISMDLQIASSCAPGAKFVVYFANAAHFDDLDPWYYYKLYSMALFDDVNRPTVLTQSAGMVENYPGVWTRAEAMIINELLAVGACLGVTCCLCSGDAGSLWPVNTFMFDMPSVVVFPTSSPWVLAVGGTTLEFEGDQVVGERVWNRFGDRMFLKYRSSAPNPPLPGHLGATGGGVSMYFELPEWQRKAEVPLYRVIEFDNWVFSKSTVFEGRGVPDISACADFLNGYQVYLGGHWASGGGTSASTPFIAAMVARINHALGRAVGWLNPVLYELVFERDADVFNRQLGNNAGFTAEPGQRWNACTGLGSPKGAELIEALRRFYAQYD
jgi:kumamolisin